MLSFKTSLLAILLMAIGCTSSEIKNSTSLIQGEEQDSIFNKLMLLTNNSIDHLRAKDSLAFLIVPLQKSCPPCKDKALDSIVKYRNRLGDDLYIILTARAGIKTVKAIFKEKNYRVPEIKNQLFLDTIDQSLQFELYDNNPAIYYTTQGRAYRKVLTLPSTIKEDLHIYFTASFK